MVAASSRRSMCVPTSRNGVLGQWWVISGTHCGGGGSGVRKHDGTIIMYFNYCVCTATYKTRTECIISTIQF